MKQTNKGIDELTALQNAINSFELGNYKVSTIGNKYCLVDETGLCLTGAWDYIRLNHFIMGYGKAFKRFGITAA